jgi:hypothetical protein
MAQKIDEFLRAAFAGDLPRVQRMLADGEARITDTDQHGCTALLRAAGSFNLPTLQWLLEEGGACITDRDNEGHSALLMAATNGRMATCQWLLEHLGADIAEANHLGTNVWDRLGAYIPFTSASEVTALLRVMVLKGTPLAWLVVRMRPEHAQVVEEGAQLRAALSAYLTQRRALLDAHCPLIAPLRDLVRDYDPEPTTTEELWSTGLGAAPQRARRPRVEAVVALPVCRLRLRQRLE